jgi:hypothetical protein
MGLYPPQYNTPLSVDQINPELTWFPIYGVTPDNKYIPISISDNGYMNVNATFSGSITIGSIGVIDESNFTFGTSLEQPIGGVYQDTNPTLSPGQTGAVRLTEYRAFHVNLRDSNGVEVLPSTEATSLSILADLNQFNFNSGALVVTTTGSTGTSVNAYTENLAVPPSSTTTLFTYTVPTASTYNLNGIIGWGTYDAEFLITINGANMGGGWSSPTNRTLSLDYSSVPIVANAGDIVAVTVTNYAASTQTFRLNVLGKLFI